MHSLFECLQNLIVTNARHSESLKLAAAGRPSGSNYYAPLCQVNYPLLTLLCESHQGWMDRSLLWSARAIMGDHIIHTNTQPLIIAGSAMHITGLTVLFDLDTIAIMIRDP